MELATPSESISSLPNVGQSNSPTATAEVGAKPKSLKRDRSGSTSDMTYHTHVQEAFLAELLKVCNFEKECKLSLKQNQRRILELTEERTTLLTEWEKSLENINTRLSQASELILETRRLSREVLSIATDLKTLVDRLVVYLVKPSGYEFPAQKKRITLSSSPQDILSSPLFSQLFQSVAFEKILDSDPKDHKTGVKSNGEAARRTGNHPDWENLINMLHLAGDENNQERIENWTVLIERFEDAMSCSMLPEPLILPWSRFQTGFISLLKAIAFSQLTKMLRITSQLDHLNKETADTRQLHQRNLSRFTSNKARITTELKNLSCKNATLEGDILPSLNESILDGVLQNVILAAAATPDK